MKCPKCDSNMAMEDAEREGEEWVLLFVCKQCSYEERIERKFK
jgi:DNA-directed RNA polymerase subunit M/transcription elongation factor TFIIS